MSKLIFCEVGACCFLFLLLIVETLDAQDTTAVSDTSIVQDEISLPVAELDSFIEPISVPSERLAVYDFNATGTIGREGKIAAERVRNYMRKTGDYYVLSSDQAALILNSQGMSNSRTCSTPDCLIRAGESLGVNTLIGGEVEVAPSAFTITLTLVDVKSKKKLNSVAQRFSGEWSRLLYNDLPRLVDRLLDVPEPGSAGSITVRSDPEGALVYVNDIKVGQTPYTVGSLVMGDYTVKIVNTIEYKEYSESFELSHSDPSKLVEVNFRFKLGQIFITGLPYGASIRFNRRYVGELPFRDKKVFWGDYDVLVKHIGYYDHLESFRIDSYGYKHIHIELERKSRALATLYSAIMPGLGQHYSEHTLRTIIYPVLFWSAVGGAVYMNFLYADALKNYESQRTDYLEALLLGNIGDTKKVMDDALDEAKVKRNIGFAVTGLTTLIYLWNVGDALLTFPPAVPDPRESEKIRFPELGATIEGNTPSLTMSLAF